MNSMKNQNLTQYYSTLCEGGKQEENRTLSHDKNVIGEENEGAFHIQLYNEIIYTIIVSVIKLLYSTAQRLKANMFDCYTS